MMLSAALTCLALNVYHEARNEDIMGQYAVAHVVLNRVKSHKYPDDICSVIHQGYREGHINCQFSWYCDGKSDTPYDELAWAHSVVAADRVMKEHIYDFTEGATNYHANYVHPYWAHKLEYVGQFGTQLFYKEH